mmetsp:Transcript_94824/g.300857  ORF Transcript_94824/g.300857 Transcript_94824/m.300857 type:complete len:417 (+) Transcript_94824:996-2246(+)
MKASDHGMKPIPGSASACATHSQSRIRSSVKARAITSSAAPTAKSATSADTWAAAMRAPGFSESVEWRTQVCCLAQGLTSTASSSSWSSWSAQPAGGPAVACPTAAASRCGNLGGSGARRSFCGPSFIATPKDTRGRDARSSCSFSCRRRSSSSRSACSSSSRCRRSTSSRWRQTAFTRPLACSSLSMSWNSCRRRCSSSRSLWSLPKIRSLSASATSSLRLLSSSRVLLSSSTCFSISCCQAFLLRSCCATSSSSFRFCSSLTSSLLSATMICSYHGGVEVPSSSFASASLFAAGAALAAAAWPGRGGVAAAAIGPRTLSGAAPPSAAAPAGGSPGAGGRSSPAAPTCAKGTVFQTRWSASKCTTTRRRAGSTEVTTMGWQSRCDSDHQRHLAPTRSQPGGAGPSWAAMCRAPGK